MEIKRNLIDLTIEELEEELSMMGQPKFRAKQIFQWCHKGVMSIDEMTNISKDLRQILKDKFRFDRCEELFHICKCLFVIRIFFLKAGVTCKSVHICS